MHVGIIGGGITGLTTAYYLLKAGHRATIYESASFLGGLASSAQVQGVWVDKFYHCILPMDTPLLSLVEELGLGENIYWTETEMGFMHGGSLYSLTTPSDLLRFSALPFWDRIRLGLTGLYSRRLKNWQALEKMTAKDWLIRFCGERAFNTVWKPLLMFKFGDRYAEAPATYLWSRVKRQATTRKESQKEVCAYVKGGFKRIIERLEEEVRRMGGTIHMNTKVDRIRVSNSQVQGLVVNDQFEHFDKVVSSVPLAQLLKLIDPKALGADTSPDSITYQGVVCVMLALKEPLSRYYWMPVVDSGANFSGIVETTNLIRREDLGGMSLVYLLNYVPRDSAMFRAEEQPLIDQTVAKLEELFPEFSKRKVLESHVYKAAFVEPLWTVNYSSLMPQREFLNGSLFVLTTAQLYPEINSTSNCVRQVKEAFDRIAAEDTRKYSPSTATA